MDKLSFICYEDLQQDLIALAENWLMIHPYSNQSPSKRSLDDDDLIFDELLELPYQLISQISDDDIRIFFLNNLSYCSWVANQNSVEGIHLLIDFMRESLRLHLQDYFLSWLKERSILTC